MDKISNKDSKDLAALVQSGQLTRDGMLWLQEALNPFADYNHQPVGYPDATPGNSVVSRVTLTKTVIVPPGFDLNVFTLPQIQARTVGQERFTTPTVDAVSGLDYGTLSICNMVMVGSGLPSTPFYDTLSNTWQFAIPVSVESFDISDYLVGGSRIVAMGVEVVNTSAELFKSGALVAYRSPQNLTPSQYVLTGEENVPGRAMIRSAMVPATAGQALQMPGSQQWEASEGVYLTGSMCQVQNNIGQEDFLDQMYFPTYRLDSNNVTAIALAPRIAGRFPYATLAAKTPWNSSGAYITGLTFPATFTVVLRLIIENFPDPDQLLLMTQAKPACPYDALALQIYSEANFLLPAGTQVKNNPDGEYWRVVKDVLHSVAPPAFSKAVKVAEKGVKTVKSIKPALEVTKNFGKDVVGLASKQKAQATKPNPQKSK